MPELHQTASPTIDLIYQSYEAKRDNEKEERTYIGGSVLGDGCERKLWLRFRWAYPPKKIEGRKLRLFETGHSQEARMIANLRAIGCEVIDRTEDGKQIKVAFADGHGGGHLDGEVTGLIEAPKAIHVLECKTHNADNFAKLKEHGVREAFPEHYAQMIVYMHLRGRERGCYLAVNKDTDELYLERIYYDAVYAAQLIVKAERIVHAQKVPQRIADGSNKWPCTLCELRESCHAMPMARRNCRTCLHVTPGPGGTWWCSRHRKGLSVDEQRQGCPNHLFLPSVVAGEQIDADLNAETVTYELADGQTWVDGECGEAA